MKKFNLIFLRDSKILLSKKKYSDWKEIQTEFELYMANVSFESLNEVVEYLVVDYKIEELDVIKMIDKITKSETEVLQLDL